MNELEKQNKELKEAWMFSEVNGRRYKGEMERLQSICEAQTLKIHENKIRITTLELLSDKLIEKLIDLKKD